jgi:HSP20 family protein
MVHYVKWEPFRDLMVMQDRMTRLFDETVSRIFKEEMTRTAWYPLVDIVEREREVLLKIDLPEINQDEIEIKVEADTLIIRGQRRLVKEMPEENYIQIERPYGNFQRTFALPKLIDREEIKATYKDGVLRVVLPRKKEVHLKQISVETR